MNDSSLVEVDLTLQASLEALLFVASIPVSIAQLVEALDLPRAEVEIGLKELQSQYLINPDSGLRIQRHRGRFQLTTAPQAAFIIQRFLGVEQSGRLSHAAIETLSIVLYLQPVTRPQLDAIRGVNSDSVLKNLLRKGLIQEEGRAVSPGRPILYSTTPELLQHFGINAVNELPPIDLEDSNEGLSPDSNAGM
ncbi:SMC-Scp complex subunit ScpB [Chloroflexota bacterium]